MQLLIAWAIMLSVGDFREKFTADANVGVFYSQNFQRTELFVFISIDINDILRFFNDELFQRFINFKFVDPASNLLVSTLAFIHPKNIFYTFV